MPFRLSKNDILHFCKNAEGLGEQRVNTFAPQMSAINVCPHLLRCGFPKFNPQSEFTSDEENSTFQGIFMPMERTVYTYSNLVKILILTKGVDFFRHPQARHFLSGNVVPFSLFPTQQYRRQNLRQRFHGIMYFLFGIGLSSHFNKGRPWQHMQAEAISIEIDFPVKVRKSCR